MDSISVAVTFPSGQFLRPRAGPAFRPRPACLGPLLTHLACPHPPASLHPASSRRIRLRSLSAVRRSVRVVRACQHQLSSFATSSTCSVCTYTRSFPAEHDVPVLMDGCHVRHVQHRTRCTRRSSKKQFCRRKPSTKNGTRAREPRRAIRTRTCRNPRRK